jgi:hypothetical protein
MYAQSRMSFPPGWKNYWVFLKIASKKYLRRHNRINLNNITSVAAAGIGE